LRTFSAASWPELQELRGQIGLVKDSATLTEATQRFCDLFASRFDTVVLARVFVILPLSALPERERGFAQRAAAPALLSETTRVLCLCGTAGVEPAWNQRLASQGHLAIPLTSSDFVRGAPMIAQLLADLRVSLRVLDDGLPVVSRELMGGRSLTFFVPDALTSLNEEGRLIIGAEQFARAHGVHSVFGMAGSYLDGTLVCAIFFTSEQLTRAAADKFSTLIAAFKLATAHLVHAGKLFDG
jgi:hypothetical protein